MMESIECPVPDCTYTTPANTDAIVVAALLNAHATTHSRDTSAKVEKVNVQQSRQQVPARNGHTSKQNGMTTRRQQK